MKTLYVIRHAKSSWTFNELDDFSRPLGKRGRKDVIKMGKFLHKNVKPPDLILSSTASRAFYTALYLADGWKMEETDVITEANLYHADSEDIVQIVGNQEEDIVAIVGHNPGFTSFINMISNEMLDNLPTCGVFGIEFDIQSWDEIERKSGQKKFYHTPKTI